MRRRWWWPACLLAALLAGACAEPPNKEMDQAQGAIDAAKAAGADQYAIAEYTAAVEALTQARQAVDQRDYRLALDRALESRERAQEAARAGADNKAQVRGEVERTMAELAALIAQANVKLEAARKARASRRALREPTETLAGVNEDLQKAGEAMKAGDYLTARPVLQEIKGRLQKVIVSLDELTTTQNTRRRP